MFDLFPHPMISIYESLYEGTKLRIFVMHISQIPLCLFWWTKGSSISNLSLSELFVKLRKQKKKAIRKSFAGHDNMQRAYKVAFQ